MPDLPHSGHHWPRLWSQFCCVSDVNDAVSLKCKRSYGEDAAILVNRFHIYLPIIIAANLKE